MNSSTFFSNLNVFSNGRPTEITSIAEINFSSASACHDVIGVLNANLSDPKSCEDCLRAIAVLLSQPNNRVKFVGLDTVQRIINVIFLHIKTTEVVEWGIRSLCMFSVDENAIEKILLADGCKIFTIVLKYYSKNNILVSEICHTIYNIALENEECKNVLRDYGLVEIIADTILIENCNNLTHLCLEWCLRAIGGLARRNEINKIAFCRYGLCEKLLDVVQKVTVKNKINTNDSSNISLVESVCWAIGNLSYPDVKNQTMLGSNGACEYVVTMMNVYVENSVFIQECFRAIRNLCYENESNLRKFADLKLCEYIVPAVSFHMQKGIQICAVEETLFDKIDAQSKSRGVANVNIGSILLTNTLNNLSTGFTLSTGAVGSSTSSSAYQTETEINIIATRGAVQWGWYAIAALAESKANIDIFKRTSVLENLKISLDRFGVLPAAAQWVCHAVSKFAIDEEICIMMGTGDLTKYAIINSLVSILKLHAEVADVVEECLGAIAAVCSLEQNKRLFSHFELESQLIKCIHIHFSTEEVCEAGCAVILRLCEGQQNTTNTTAKGLFTAGVCKLLPSLMIQYYDNIRIAEYCCVALTLLASNEAVNQRLGSSSASTAVIAVMNAHITDIYMLTLTLKSIMKLYEYEGNISGLRNDGVCGVITKALMLNMETSEDVSRLCLEVISLLASDDGCKLKFLNDERSITMNIVKCMNLYNDNKTIAMAACKALSHLCGGFVYESTLDKQFNQRAMSQSINSNINKTKSNSYRSTKKVQNFQQLPFTQATTGNGQMVRVLSHNNLVRKSDTAMQLNIKFGEHKACEMVGYVLLKHKNDLETCMYACSAINSLAEFPSNKLKLLRTYAEIVNVIDMYRDNAAVVNVAFMALGTCSLTNDDTKSQDILGNLGICELIVQCLTKYVKTSSHVSSSICRLIPNIAFSSIEIKLKLLSLNCMNLLETCLQKNMDSDLCSRYTVSAIGELTIDVPLEILLPKQSNNICLLTLQAIEKYIDNSKLVQAGCMTIVSLRHFNEIMSQAKACELIVLILTKYADSEVGTQCCLRAIGSLAVSPENRVHFLKTNVCELVCLSLQKHVGNESILSVMLMRSTSSVHVARYGCDAIYYLTRNPNDCKQFQSVFDIYNAVECVGKTLQKYSEIDVIACACFRAILVLAKDNINNSSKFGFMGLCHTIVECLRLFPSSVEVAKWGCRCVAVLSENNQQSTSKFISIGVCEVLPVVIQAHTLSKGVAEAGADSIVIILANTDKNDLISVASRFGRAGACEALVTAIRIHKDHSMVVERVCEAIASLSIVHGNSGWFGATGCLEGLIAANLIHFNVVEVSSSSLKAIGNLCIDENNRSKFVENQACEVVMESFKRHMSHSKMAICGAFAIEKLSETKDETFSETTFVNLIDSNFDSMSGNDIKIKIESAYVEVAETSSQQQVHMNRSHDGMDKDDLISKASNAAERETQSASESSVLSVLQHEKSSLPDNAISGGVDISVPSSASSSSSSHSNTSSSMIPMYVRSKSTAKGKFFNCKVHEVLIDALYMHHTSSAEVVCQISSTISKLSQGYGGSKHPDRLMFGSRNACQVILNALRSHPSNENVALWTFSAISELIKDNRKNKLAVRSNNGCELIVSTLKQFRLHTSTPQGASIVESACVIIYHLCLNSKTAKIIIFETSGIKIILEILESYQKSSVETIYASCLALYQICYGLEIAVNTLCLGNAAEILTNTVNRFMDVKSIVNVALSIMILMSNQASLLHQEKLTDTGIAKLLPTLMLKYDKDRFGSITMTFCALITILCYKNVKTKIQLGQMGICKTLYMILEKHVELINDTAHNVKYGKSLSGRGSRTYSSASSILAGFNNKMINSSTSHDLSQIDITEFTNQLMTERDIEVESNRKKVNANLTTSNYDNMNRRSMLNSFSIEDILLPRQSLVESEGNSLLPMKNTTASNNNSDDLEQLFSTPGETKSLNSITFRARARTDASFKTPMTTITHPARESAIINTDYDQNDVSSNEDDFRFTNNLFPEESNNDVYRTSIRRSTSMHRESLEPSLGLQHNHSLNMSGSIHKDVVMDDMANDIFSTLHIFYGLSGRDEFPSTSTLALGSDSPSTSDIMLEECLRAVGNLIIDCEPNKSKMIQLGLLDMMKPVFQSLNVIDSVVSATKTNGVSENNRRASKHMFNQIYLQLSK